MTLHYAEFDTTQANLLADLRTHIMAGGDWTRPNATDKPDCYKTVTSEGVSVVFDLTDAPLQLHYATIGVYRDYDGLTFTDKTSRWLYWRGSSTGATTSMQLHCIVSASSDHIFISVEGPRANEPFATSATLGSVRNYFFLDTMLRYHEEDLVPIVFAGGQMAASNSGSVGNNSFQGNFTLGSNGNPWSIGKLLTLDFPSLNSTETVQATRQSSFDGNYYLSPYVAFGDEAGLRGRLANFFHAGFTTSDTPDIPPPPHGQKVTYEGRAFKLLAVSKSDGSISTWSQFGSASNGGTGTFYRSPVVAVPCLP